MSFPHLIFLHGLLGDRQDWQKVRQNLAHFSTYALDLPLHGNAITQNVDDFSQTCRYLEDKIYDLIQDHPYYLVGYSLGGRIALYYALLHSASSSHKNLKGIILEGANLGLSSTSEREQRWKNDGLWAQRFAGEPIETVLNDWYQQGVFAHLTPAQRRNVIQRRAQNNGQCIAKMLQATSLAKQPDFRPHLSTCPHSIDYLVGEYDQKFRQMAQQAGLSHIVIEKAGHNAHLENPTAFANAVESLLKKKISANSLE